MTTPGADHPVTIEPAGRRWRAAFAGHVIADSDDAMILHERGHGPVVYFPRADVSMEYLSTTDRKTTCPHKGDAGYFTLLMDGQFAENAVWTYEQPHDGVDAIAGRLAFYTDQVEVYAVDDATVNPHHVETSGVQVDDVVQHTDSGAGRSQREPWAPTVEPPSDDGVVR